MRVAGDEFAAVELGQALSRHCPEIGSWQIYDTKEAGYVSADIIIVMWPEYPLLKRSFKKVMWLQNGGWASQIPQFQEHFDIVFCASKLLCERFPGLFYLPAGCSNSKLYRPLPPDPRFESEICFLGNYSKEGRSAEHAARYMLPATDFQFDIWGSGWESAQPPILRQFNRGRLPVKLTPVVLSSCKTFLSYHSRLHRQDDMPSGRVFDALACEAFVISDYMPSLEIFEPYVVFTTGGDDLREKIRYFLMHPEARDAKVCGARSFILHYHTNAHRAKEIARVLGLKWVESTS